MAESETVRKISTKRLVGFDPIDLAILRAVADQYGFGARNISSTIRFIIRSWAKSTGIEVQSNGVEDEHKRNTFQE